MSGKERVAKGLEWMEKVLLDGALTPAQVRIALILQRHADQDYRAWPSVETLANLANLTTRTVKAALAELVSLGWLRVQKGGGRGRTNCYLLSFEGRFLKVKSLSEWRRAKPETVKQTPPKEECKNSEAYTPVSAERVKKATVKGEKNVQETVKQTPPEPIYVNPTNEPDSLASLEKGDSRPAKQTRGSRIPPNWMPTEDGMQILRGKGFSEADIEAEADNFRDHWLGESTQKGIKLDWQATWRKWCRSNYCKPKTKQHRKSGDGFLDALKGNSPSHPTTGVVIDADFQRMKEQR